MEAGMRIKIFDNTNVDTYVRYIHDCGFNCHVFRDYILVGSPLPKYRIDGVKLGNIIRSTREQKKMTRRAFSRAIDVNENTAFFWELGQQTPKDHNLNKICEVLDIDKYELIKACRKELQ